MYTLNIQLSGWNDVKEFVQLTQVCPYIMAKQGQSFIDCRSILGIFSLDLSKTIELSFKDDSYVELFAKFAK